MNALMNKLWEWLVWLFTLDFLSAKERKDSPNDRGDRQHLGPFRDDTECPSLANIQRYVAPPVVYPVQQKRNLRGETVAAVFLDLSTSMAVNAEETYNWFCKLQELSSDIWVILCGFNQNVFLLYEGPISGMPIYNLSNFKRHTEGSLLNHGTAFYLSLCHAAQLVPQLLQADTASILVITDGENSMPPSLEVAQGACLRILASKIPLRLIGISGNRATEFSIVPEGAKNMLRINPLEAMGENDFSQVSDATDAFKDSIDFLKDTLRSRDFDQNR